MSKKVRIIFRGEIVAGEAESAVKQRAAQLLKATPEQIQKIFSGKPIVLRKDLPEEDGPRYQKRLENAGMRVYVEKMKDKNTPSLPPRPPPAKPYIPRVPFPEISVPPEPEPVAAPVAPATPQRFPADVARASAAPEKRSIYGSKPSLLFPTSDEESAVPVLSNELSLMEEAPPEEIECPKCRARQPRRKFCQKCGVDMPQLLKDLEAQKAAFADPGAALAALHGAGEYVEGKDFKIIDEEEAKRAKGKFYNK